jgi:hypothetical protein
VPLYRQHLPALRNLTFVQRSFVQTTSQTLHEIHPLMKDRYDQSGRTLARQTKDVVMFAPRHS